MADKFIAKVEVAIKAPLREVRLELTKPELIKQYLFDTVVTTDWRIGSPITYRGVWEGKPYEDKGTIIQNEPERLLVSTYWSSLEGLADKRENYKTVSYELAAENGTTKLTLTQDNNASKEAAEHSEQNWKTVLGKLKELLEK